MQFFSVTLPDWIVWLVVIVIGGLLVYVYLLRFGGVRTYVRLEYRGGLETLHAAKEANRVLLWQDKDGNPQETAIRHTPRGPIRFGRTVRVFTVDELNMTETTQWIDPASVLMIESTEFEPALDDEGKPTGQLTNKHKIYRFPLDVPLEHPEVLRKQMRSGNMFRQLAAGLKSINKWYALVLILLGVFVGLFLAPLVPWIGEG